MSEYPMIPLNNDAAIERVTLLAALVRELREHVFVAGSDYGAIPGTNDKPVLLLPGMEKLMRALRLRAEYVERRVIVDFDRPLFFFEYECRLYEIDSDLCMSTAVGSANSHESKWRWRESKRICPKCETANIKRSQYPPRDNPNAEPGWYCYAKTGGCGANFAATDKAITDQQTGRMENPDIADQLNTICKIAQKRALGSAIKGAANVSEFFTVDLEDLPQYEINKPVYDSEGGAVRDTVMTDVVEAAFEEVAPPIAEPMDARTVRKFIDDWRAQALDDSDVLAALNVAKLREWTQGVDAANRRVAAWLNEQLDGAPFDARAVFERCEVWFTEPTPAGRYMHYQNTVRKLERDGVITATDDGNAVVEKVIAYRQAKQPA